MTLKDQIFDCLPSGHYAFTALLKIVDVVETTDIPTAAVECTRLPRLLINPEFVRKQAGTSEKLFALVMHELYHVLLGHTRRFKRVTPLDNFVFDCMINALLCRQFPEVEFTTFFTDFYSEDEFPSCLLRPPAKWSPRSTVVQLPAALVRDFPGVELTRQVYRSLYSQVGVTYYDLYELLPKVLKQAFDPGEGFVPVEGFVPLEEIDLLGGHGHDGHSDQGVDANETLLHEALSDIVRRWPAPPEPLAGWSLDGFLSEDSIVVTTREQDKSVLGQLIAKLAKFGRQQADFKTRSNSFVTGQSPVRPPHLHRKDWVRSQLGFSPLLFECALPAHQNQKEIEPVHVYLDVSGSVQTVLPALYGAVLLQGRKVHPEIHLFSTEVHDIHCRELQSGTVKTTGGTDIACVAKHIDQNQVQRALLITDGWVGKPSGAVASALRKTQLAVAYTPQPERRNLAPYVTYSAQLSLDEGRSL